MPEELDDLPEGERNAQTHNIDDIVARSRRERDEELVEEGLLDKSAIEGNESPDIHLDASDPGEDALDNPVGSQEDLDDVKLPKYDGSEEGASDDSPPAEEELSFDENKPLDKSPTRLDNFVYERDGKSYMVLTQNGQQVDMPLEKVRAIVQKQNNADLQTTLANQSKQNYDTLTAEVEQQLRSTSSGDDTPEVAVSTEALNKALKVVVDGDFDEGVEQLADVLRDALKTNQPNAPQYTPQTIRKIVGDVIENRDLGSAYITFSKIPRYQVLLADPAFSAMIDAESDTLTKDIFYMQGKPSFLDILQKSGDNVLERVQSAFGVKKDDSDGDDPVLDDASPSLDDSPTTSDQEKVARKRAHQSSVVRASAAKRSVEETPLPLTSSQIIANLAKARNQNILS